MESIQSIFLLCLFVITSYSSKQLLLVETGNSVMAPHCNNELSAIIEKLNSETDISRQDSLRKLVNKRLWTEAKTIEASLTDTTFLKTKEEISYSAIAPMNRNGFNPYYAYNQVIYLKALDRARKRLSVKDNRLHFPYKDGIELNISHDLYLFICYLFKECNHWLDSGKYEIIKDEQGLYTVALSRKKSD